MSRFIRRISLVFALCYSVATAFPTAVSATTTADLIPVATATFTRPGTVRVLVPLSGDRMLIAGEFIAIGNHPAQGIAILDADGSIDPSFRVDPRLKIRLINAAAVQPDGKILIGGWFRIQSLPGSRYLLRLHANGQIDDSLRFETLGIVHTLLFDNNKIVVGGNFWQPTPYLARLNLDGSADTLFQPGTGPNAAVYSIARQNDGRYLIAGDFTTYNDVTQAGLARLQPNGALDTDFVPRGWRISRRIAVLKDGTIVVGSSTPCNDESFAWYTPQGIRKPLPETPPSWLAEITALLPLPDGGFLVGGWYTFSCVQGSPVIHRGEVWRYAANGTFHTLTQFSETSDVFALALRDDEKLWVGGNSAPQHASQIGIFNGLALLDLANDGLERIPAYNLVVSNEADIMGMSLYPDGRVLVVGSFSHVNGQPRYGIARLLADGRLEPDFAPFADQPRRWGRIALALADGRALVGTNDGLYLINTDQQVTNLSALNNYNDPWVLAQQPDGKVLIGNNGSLRRLRADLSTVDMDISTSGAVYNVAIIAGGKILVAGTMGVIRLHNDGTIDNQFTAPAFTNDAGDPSTVNSLAVLSDGSIIAGGIFTRVNNTAQPTIARLTSTGAFDNTFPGLNGVQSVNTICAQNTDNAIWLGGSSSAGQPLIAHISATGAQQTIATYTALSNTGSIRSVLCASDHMRWAGGTFSLIDNQSFYGVARYLQVRSRVFTPLVIR
ncbi:delta-60 repeat domain-containing protein [uncultured Chloroflexus sp.]|uniref:delta-60 repeat domain-containing protein n=1 Tax=uncultured Chloroflexus sp. TaxID=214040 RepID=UPI00262D3697|nr:delta-60 repeat domain-containing protein [uncultured Chloroflexus sp.]